MLWVKSLVKYWEKNQKDAITNPKISTRSCSEIIVRRKTLEALKVSGNSRKLSEITEKIQGCCYD